VATGENTIATVSRCLVRVLSNSSPVITHS